LEAANYGEAPFTGKTLSYRITDETGKVYASGRTGTYDLPLGNNILLGSLTHKLDAVVQPSKLTLSISLDGTDLRNHWDFWVYPAQIPTAELQPDKTILIRETLDSTAIATLKQGGKVLLLSAGKVSYGKDVVQQFVPVFWNTSWFKMRPPHTTGLLIDQQHPLFRNFPTSYHSDLQWWELANRAQVMQFTDFPADFQPTVQSIDTWFLSRKIGMLFEANVGGGRLLMTSIDVQNGLDQRPVARQLRKAILDYMKSEDFRPRHTIDIDRVADLFTKIAEPVNSYTKSSPDELRPTSTTGR
jgi:hypothetical protein